MELDWHLGDVIRKLRERRRLSQTALGKLAADEHGKPVDKGTISRVERQGAGRVSLSTLRRIATALGVTVDGLDDAVPDVTQITILPTPPPSEGGKKSRRATRPSRFPVAASDRKSHHPKRSQTQT